MDIKEILSKQEEFIMAQLEAQEKEIADLKELLENIRKLRKKQGGSHQTHYKAVKVPITKKSATTKPLSYPTEYSSKLKLYQKVYVALLKIKKGDVDQVAASLKKLDPFEKKYKNIAFVRKAAANGLFQLYNKQKKIDAVQAERGRYIYSIK